MRLRIALFILIIGSDVRLEGSTLRGIVLYNELGGKPARRVKVSAIGANFTETGESGSFTLHFPNLQPGDRVTVVLSMPGFVVVNDFQLRAILPRDPNPFALPRE
jgi:hypothetical protein